MQYKQRCSDLESQLSEHPVHPEPIHPLPAPCHMPTSPTSTALEQAQQHLRDMREERIADLDTALTRLDEERRRYIVHYKYFTLLIIYICSCDSLMRLNKTLRDQLEESHHTNEALTTDLQKLTNDWEEMREEMLLKEEEWKDEEQAFNDYYSSEHNRLLNLWRDVVSMKRLFMDIQSTTERDLTKLKTDIGSIARDMNLACTRVDLNINENKLAVSI